MLTLFLRRRIGRRMLSTAVEKLDASIENFDASPWTKEECASILRQCGAEGCLHRAKRLHSLLIRHSRDHGSYVGNLIIEMYGACGGAQEAATVFANMRDRNVFTWTIVIKAFARNGHFEKALEVYHRMNVTPNRVTFIGVLGVCSNLVNLEQGRKIHGDILKCGLENDLVVQNSLIHMYGKCGSATEAMRVFGTILDKDVVSWNSIIDALVSCGQHFEAVETYRRMKMGPDGTTPNVVTFITVLAGCSNLGEVSEVRFDIRACRLEKNPVIGSKLVTVYAKCGSVSQAKKFFDIMVERVVVSWNAMISAYAQNGHLEEALYIYREMELDGTRPDESTFVNVISCVEDLKLARWLENRIVVAGYDVHTLGAGLVNMFGKLGSIQDAKRIFESCSNRDLAMWNSMIAAFAHNRYRNEAVDIYRKMVDVTKDEITFMNVLGACTTTSEVTMVHEDAAKSKGYSDKVKNALISSYSKCGDLESAKQVFEGMDEGCRNAFSWGAMINSYTQHGHPLEAFTTFEKSCEDGRIKPDVFMFSSLAKACSELGNLQKAKFVRNQVIRSGLDQDTQLGTAMINMFAKCGSMEDSCSIFSRLQDRDVVCWTSMMSAFVNLGYGHEALWLLRQMDLEGVKPNAITFVSAVEACGLTGDSSTIGKSLHQRIVSLGYDRHETLRTVLINMYSRSGNLADACTTFQGQGNDALEWTAMITACARLGTIDRALELVQEMELCGVPPDVVTLISVLSMCSHAGMVKQGWDYFSMMSSEYGIQLRGDHFACLVDLLGRAGWVQEAEELVLNMPCKPDVVTWTSFLGACNMHGDVERGKLASSKLMELDDDDSGTFIMMANTQMQSESPK